MKPFAPIEQSFAITFNYKLYFTKNLFSVNNPLFKDVVLGYRSKTSVKMIFVVDEGVYQHHSNLLDHIKAYCNAHSETLQFTTLLTVPGGETSKNDHGNVDQVLKIINDNHICRHSFVVVIGGGAVIDMAGYAAAIAHRGINLIRIPTTVLSQNDAAVGVKNGINTFGKKNFLGTFAPPYAIINDIQFLNTLEDRDWIAGISEAVKVALIKDSDFFDYIEQNAGHLRDRDMECMQHLIYRCAQIHMQHIAEGGDPFENGSSRPLDFGHWAAHKLEDMMAYRIRHGEAVAIGMVLDMTYAFLMGFLEKDILLRAIAVLEAVGFNLRIPLKNKKEIDHLLGGIEEFREHLGGQLTITLISSVGTKHDVHEIDRSKMREAMDLQNQLTQLETLG